MRTILIAVIVAGSTYLSATSEAQAQLSVQQPVIQSTGGHFAVSVPDRGGIHLGSVSRAGESRSSYGFPFTRGSSVGRYTQHSSMSAYVWIHDLREMDRLILEMAESDPQGLKRSTSESARRAGLAWTEFQPRRGVTISDRRPSQARLTQRARAVQYSRPAQTSRLRDREPAESRQMAVPSARRSRALDPAHSLRLGIEAEESGKLRLAKLHYEVAAQYGSVEAGQRLRELSQELTAAE